MRLPDFDGDDPGNRRSGLRRSNRSPPLLRRTKAAPAKAGPAPTLVLDTAKGTIEIETFPEDAPKTVQHVVALVKKNFYNGMRFHRAEENFLVQVGDPQSRDMSREAWWGRGPGSGSQIGVAEITKKRRHVRRDGGDGARRRPQARRQPVLHHHPAASRPRRQVHHLRPGHFAGMDVVKKLKKADILKKASVKE